MKNFKEITIGIILLVLIVIGGNLYNGFFGGLWFKLINSISKIF